MRAVMSIDPGLRNLAVAVIKQREGWTWPESCTQLAHPGESKEDFHRRALGVFAGGDGVPGGLPGWTLDHLQVFDVSAALDREVANVKLLSLVDKVHAVCATFETIEREWFPDGVPCPNAIVAEIQHNTNAEMKAVCMSALVFFRRSMPDTVLKAITGTHKLKVCDALGFREGSGLASKRVRAGKTKSAPATATASDSVVSASVAEEASKSGFRKVGGKWVRTRQGNLDKYEDNKRRSILALNRLLPEYKHSTSVKMDDVADALLQGIWVLWLEVAPPKPRAKPGAAAAAAAAAAPQVAVPKPSVKRRRKPQPQSAPCFIDLVDSEG
jgi:hypothetical protein